MASVIPIRPPFFGRLSGVVLYDVERGSRAWANGLRRGDIITSINNRPVKNLEQFVEVVNRDRDPLLFRVRRGNSVASMVIK